jgi:hypothetical protein
LNKQLDFFSSVRSEGEEHFLLENICNSILRELDFTIKVLNKDLSVIEELEEVNLSGFKVRECLYDTLTSIRSNRVSQAKYVAFMGGFRTYEEPYTFIGIEDISYTPKMDSTLKLLLKKLQLELDLSDVDNKVLNKVYKLI